MNHYGNTTANYSLEGKSHNKSANRYNADLIDRQKEKNRSKREMLLMRDRLHILNRMSESLNNENKSDTDFSDVKSIKQNKRIKIHNPYMLESETVRKNQVSLNLKDRLNGYPSRNASERQRAKINQTTILNRNRTSKHFGSDEDMPEEFAQYHNIDSAEDEDLE